MEDDIRALLPRRRIPWAFFVLIGVGVLTVLFAYMLYERMGQRGLSLRGPGHVVNLGEGGTWVFFANDGVLVPVTAESVGRFGVERGGRCERIDGWLSERELVVEEAVCEEGGLQDAIVARMRLLGFRFGYWPETIESTGETLDEVLHTVEIYVSFIQPDAQAPQLVALFKPLFPEVLPTARLAGLPPPVFISAKRNDLAIVRVTRSELASLYALPEYVFAGAAAKGGWIVRHVRRAPDGEGDFGRLLVAPSEAPWPVRLTEHILLVAPNEWAPGRMLFE